MKLLSYFKVSVDSGYISSFEVKTVYSPWLRALHRFVYVVNWIILL